MNRDSRIFVAGHRGLVGSAITRCLASNGYTNVIAIPRQELDLTNQSDTRRFFANNKPEVVILAAAKVGGINANSSYPVDFIYDNLAIQTNVIHEAFKSGVENLLFLGSSCIYPRDCPQPMREEYLLTGSLEPTNRAYALAKISGIEMCWAYNRQHSTRYIAVKPTNLYGQGDNYDLETSHVLPALIRRIHESKISKVTDFNAWGTGQALREFLYSDDMADACLTLLETSRSKLDDLFSVEKPPLINIGSGVELRICDLVELVAQIVGFEGRVTWQTEMPDGAPRKLLDSTRIRNMGWRPKINLTKGIGFAYKEFQSRYSD